MQVKNKHYASFDSSIHKINKLSADPNSSLFSKGAYLTAHSFEIYSFYNSISISNKIERNFQRETPERLENDIQSFSRHSRNRFMKLLSRINMNHYSSPLLVTLTFHKIYPSESRELKNCLDKYVKRLRRVLPDIAYIYRLEFQKRGAPHFHFILFPPKDFSQANFNRLKISIKNAWREYLEDKSLLTKLYSTDVKLIENASAVFKYVTKYCAKVDTEATSKKFGRRWGHSTNLDLSPVCKFNFDQFQIGILRKIIRSVLEKKFKMPQSLIDHISKSSEIFVFCDFETKHEILLKFALEIEDKYLEHQVMLSYLKRPES